MPINCFTANQLIVNLVIVFVRELFVPIYRWLDAWLWTTHPPRSVLYIQNKSCSIQ